MAEKKPHPQTRMIQDCEKTDVVLEIVSFTSVQLCAYPCQLKEISKNKERNRCKIPISTYCMSEKVVLVPANPGSKVIEQDTPQRLSL